MKKYLISTVIILAIVFAAPFTYGATINLNNGSSAQDSVDAGAAGINTTDSSQTSASKTSSSNFGLVKCGQGNNSAQADAEDCDFSAVVSLINNIITYLIIISAPLAAIAFAIAGWMYLTSGGSESKVDKAKKIFIDVGIGFILVLSSWLIFKTIENTFLSTDYSGKVYLK